MNKNLRPHQRKLANVKQSSVTRFKKPTNNMDDYNVITEENRSEPTQLSFMNGTNFTVDPHQQSRTKDANYFSLTYNSQNFNTQNQGRDQF